METDMTILHKAALASASLAAIALAACSDNSAELGGASTAPASEMAATDPNATMPGADPAVSTTTPGATTAEAATQNIVQVASAEGQFTTLLKAASAAGLEDELTGPTPITVFAPTDAAFAALPAGTLDDLMKPENKAQLEALLQHHIVAGRVSSTDLATVDTAQTMNGDVAVNVAADNSVKVAEATVVEPDIQTSNGVIHVVDKVLIPAT
jgi:uncharacterized surface protein with fasciclin (FAS1) repeats